MSFNNFGQGPGGNNGPMSGNTGGMRGMPGLSGQSLTDQLPPEYAGLANLSEEDRNAALAALLGPEGLQQLQQQQQQQQQQQMGLGGGMGGPGSFLGMQSGMGGGHGGMGGGGGMANTFGMGGRSEGMTDPTNYGGMNGDMTNSMGMGGQGGTGGYGGMGMQGGGIGNMGNLRGMRPEAGGGRMDYGSGAPGPAMSGNSNFGGHSMGPTSGSSNLQDGMGLGGSMYRGGGGGNGQRFTTPQNFMGQRAGSQYGESQLPPTMAGGRGGSGGAGGQMGGDNSQGNNTDPSQQLIGYVRATAESCTDPIAQGMNTILILDTSSSMVGEGMDQARAAIEDILTGIEENAMDNGLEENVALIVFGRESKVVQHLTNEFTKFRDALEFLHPDGPSSIVDCLVMTLGMADRGGHIDVGGHVANSRIIILSDAQFTTNDPSSSFTDEVDPGHADQMANEVSHLANQVTSSSGLQLIFIPVGSVNRIFMDAVVTATNGQICLPSDAMSLSKGYLHHVIAGCVLTQSQGTVPDRSMVAAVATEKYIGVNDTDIDAVMGLIRKDQNQQTQGVGRAQGTQPPSNMGPAGSLPAGLFNGPGSSSTQGSTGSLPASQFNGLGSSSMQGSTSTLPAGIFNVPGSSSMQGPTTTLPAGIFNVPGSSSMQGPTSSLPAGIFNVPGSSSTPGNQGSLPFKPKQSRDNTSSNFPGLDFFEKNLPSGSGESEMFDLNGPLPPGLPPALIGGEGARRAPEERTPAVIIAEVMKSMKVPPELEETRRRTWTLTEEIIEEMKRDMTAGKDAPRPWDSPALQEFLLIRKDGTKIEQGSDGIIIGDDEEAKLRREEKAKQKLLWEELKKNCEGHPELPNPLNFDDDDIGELTEERVNELLDDFGGGPPNIENLPIMPAIGLRVKPGPDWMWKSNGVGIFETGTVISIDAEDQGWIRVKWDEHDGLEEDYRWGLDYEFDVEPIKGGMDAVIWPEGKARITKTTQDIADEFGPKQVKEKLRASARARREAMRKAEASGDPIKPTYKSSVPQNVNNLNLQNNAHNLQASSQQATTSLLPERVPKATSNVPVTTATSTTSVSTEGDLKAKSPATGPVAATSQTKADTNKESSKDHEQSQTARPTAAAKPSETCFVWQYNEQGNWKNYPPDIQRQLEETYLKRKEKGTVMIKTDDGQYERVVFQCMEQRNNVNKKKTKKVRRIEADAESLRELQELWAK